MLFTVDLGREQKWKYYVGICGFRDCPTTSNLEKLLDRVRTLQSDRPLLIVQLFDADKIATHHHLLASAVYALQAFKISRSVSKSIGTESLLYASTQRQIDAAIDRVGLTANSRNVATNVIGSESDSVVRSIEKVGQAVGGEADDNVLTIREQSKIKAILRIFEISDAELKATETGSDMLQLETALVKKLLSRMSIMAISK
jgi:tRNA threonylcarbamoyladenosine modification (KEOPS) complex Cgi121 subunit